MPDKLREAYRGALERVARTAGVTPEELEESFQKNYDALQVTSACLTLAEVESLCSGEFLSPKRDEHTRECEYCRALLRAIKR